MSPVALLALLLGADVSAARIVYLNKNGVTLTPGTNDARLDRSTLVSQPVTIPRWDVSNEQWNDTVTCLREMFVAFDVEITETNPGSVPHMEAVFGGTPDLLGRPPESTGVSPISTSCNVIDNSIIVAFARTVPGNPRAVCETAAQELGHSFGLIHALLASDVMSYLPYAGRRGFQDQLVECGETEARACGVEGYSSCRDKQNSFELLLERIGPAGVGDVIDPTVTIMSPPSAAVVDPGFVVTADVTDNIRVKLATLSIDGITVDSLAAPPWVFETPLRLAPGEHLLEVTATDGANERVAAIEVSVRGTASDDDAASELPFGCSATRQPGWLLALLALVLVRFPRARAMHRSTRNTTRSRR